MGDFKGVLLPQSIHKANPGNCCCALELLSRVYSTCNCFYCKQIGNNAYELVTVLFMFISYRCNGYTYIYHLAYLFSLEVTLILGACERFLRPIWVYLNIQAILWHVVPLPWGTRCWHKKIWRLYPNTPNSVSVHGSLGALGIWPDSQEKSSLDRVTDSFTHLTWWVRVSLSEHTPSLSWHRVGSPVFLPISAVPV